MKSKQATYVSLLALTMFQMTWLLGGCGKPSTGAEIQTGSTTSEERDSKVKKATSDSESLDPALVLFGLSSK